MKILHTSDLHLGKSLNEESFYEDQKYILDQLIDIIKEEDVKVVMIPGDIYDKSIPSAEAVTLFDDFLSKLSHENINILITSGNHDSNDRLSFGSKIFRELNIHIVSHYEGSIDKVSIEDVDFYLLPFLKPFHIKNLLSEEEYESINSTNDMMKFILDKESLDKSKKNILLCHQFVTWNGEEPVVADSETATLGTLDNIDASLFDSFDYVALGHVHRPQKIKRNVVRYSGTPLKYSFSEVNDNKSVVLIDSDNIEDFKLIPLKPLREVSILKGTFEEVMNMEPTNNIIKVELEDDEVLLSPMDEIKKRFPNAISLEFINRKYSSDEYSLGEITEEMSPLELFNNFFKSQMERDMSEEEVNYLNKQIEALEEDK